MQKEICKIGYVGRITIIKATRKYLNNSMHDA